MYKVINNSTFCHLRLGLTRPLDNHKTMSLLHSINSSWYPLLIICYILCHLCSLLSFAFKMDPEGLPLPREFQRVTSPTEMRSGSGKQIDISSLYWNSSTIEWDEVGFLAFLFPFDIWKQTARESERKKLILWNLKTLHSPSSRMSHAPFFAPVNLLVVLNAPEIPAKRQVWAFWETAIEPLRYLRKSDLRCSFHLSYFQLLFGIQATWPIDLWDVLKNTVTTMTTEQL